MVTHICKTHGELSEKDIYLYGKKNRRKECLKCKKLREKRHYAKRNKKNSEEKKAAVSEIDSIYKIDDRILAGQKSQLRIMRMFNNFKLK